MCEEVRVASGEEGGGGGAVGAGAGGGGGGRQHTTPLQAHNFISFIFKISLTLI